jgi:hypothetical protein
MAALGAALNGDIGKYYAKLERSPRGGGSVSRNIAIEFRLAPGISPVILLRASSELFVECRIPSDGCAPRGQGPSRRTESVRVSNVTLTKWPARLKQSRARRSVTDGKRKASEGGEGRREAARIAADIDVGFMKTRLGSRIAPRPFTRARGPRAGRPTGRPT